jgi:hypothetical protein
LSRPHIAWAPLQFVLLWILFSSLLPILKLVILSDPLPRLTSWWILISNGCFLREPTMTLLII